MTLQVHYGVKVNNRFMCTYVGGDVDVYDEKFDEDRLPFF
jgi:hypothetical protein